MTSKTPRIVESEEERQEETGAEDVLLRDESDEIIDNLKRQLGALQKQLVRYRQGARARADARESWQAGLTPHIASRLQMPAEELTARLERLIEQVSEPELRAELERSRDTAYFLFATFRRISERHEALTESLSADVIVLEAEEFCQRLADSMRQRALPVEVTTLGPLPGRITLAPQSVITVLTTLADLAVELFGTPTRLEISCPAMQEATGEDPPQLCLQIASEREWAGVEQDSEVATVAIRSGVRSPAVVDLLYVEKILEMRGGTLGFHRRGGRAHGFRVCMPIGPQDASGEPPGGQ